MDYVLMPDKLLIDGSSKPNVAFVSYASEVPIVKGKSRLTQHMISLITHGEKIIYTDGRPISLNSKSILLLSAGNYLFTERLDGSEKVKSILVFFDSKYLQNIVNANSLSHNNDLEKAPYAIIDKDDYLSSFISSVESLLNFDVFSEAMQAAKLNELLVYLYTKYPEVLHNFQDVSIVNTTEERIQKITQQNVFNNLSVSELAFFCHVSLPTFKRKFQQLYKQSPAKWMQEQRLTAAAVLLRKGVKPSEVYLQVGYENHSSFSQAFKAHFGLQPKDYL
ncbi:AraC family transcriptional regulator [Flavobacterium sp. MC2016-06]|jgi:AraC-like DNA-binding protein|uniref:AraC family transcriptional regulator n=1 Tax=Flavobacterium sp. MC2016-06 TaxID=2676308 RepID=UPI0012BA6CE2|nr:AraC family transcriptional regulator [Flavobacterium sp. MC2016-06]MBU3861860.1 AraC family transcriptional regulator [Flavobacterium sp. MC2016-06]